MAGGDTLDFKVFGGITGEFEDFGCEIFKDSGDIDGSCVRKRVSVFESWMFVSSKEVK